MNGLCLQHLAGLGFDLFKALIQFIQLILRVGYSNHKKYYNVCQTCKKLRANAEKRGVNISVTNPKIGLSKASERRHNLRIGKSFKFHGEALNINKAQMKSKWITYEHNTNPKTFTDHETLNNHKMREFNSLQKYLWQEFHNNPERITNLMLNAVNRRHSYRDLQETRVAVSYVLYLTDIL